MNPALGEGRSRLNGRSLPVLAHTDEIPRSSTCRLLRVKRTQLSLGKFDANDPEETSPGRVTTRGRSAVPCCPTPIDFIEGLAIFREEFSDLQRSLNLEGTLLHL